jgi:hypothetical protein
MPEPFTPPLEGRSTLTSLAPQTARLVAAPDHHGPGCQRGRAQPVDDAWPSGGPRSPPAPIPSWGSLPVDRRPTRPLACPAAATPRSLRVPGGCCGRANAWPPSFVSHLRSPLTRAMALASARPGGGVRKRRPAVPANATQRPSPSGTTRRGRPSKRAGSPWANDRLHRCIRLLSPAQRGPHLCPSRPDAHPAGMVHPRSPLRYPCESSCGSAGRPRPGSRHQCGGRGGLARASAARRVWSDSERRGWHPDPSLSGHSSIPRQGRCAAPSSRAPTGLCSGADPWRGSLATAQRRGAAPCVLLQ